MNDKWAKAYVRLASAYIALGNHSNDACQSLQNAIRLDPSNAVAKQMLMKELRRDRRNHHDQGGHQANSTTTSNNDTNRTDDNTVHVEDVEDDDSGNTRPTYVNESEYTNNDARPSAPPMPPNNNNDDIDDTPTFLQRIQHKIHQFYWWYRQDASDDWKSFIQVLAIIFVLYIAMGGRFGFESSLANHRNTRSCTANGNNVDGTCSSGSSGSDSGVGGGTYGDYGKGNAYDQFYQSNQRDTHYRRTEGRGGSGTYGSTYDGYDARRTGGSSYSRDSYHGSNRYQHDDDDTYYNRYDRYDSNYGSRGGGSYYNNRNRQRTNHGSSDWDVFFPYIIIGGIVLLLNRFLGVPIQVMPMGFGMRRGFRFGHGGGIGLGGFGGFVPRVRFGRGGMRFGFGGIPGGGMGYGVGGGFPMGGGARGGGVRFGRRRWY